MSFFPIRGPNPHGIPVEKLVNRFSQSFTTEQNHFVRYLESGFDDFERYYRIHQPKTTLQAHFIDHNLPGPAESKGLDVPWQRAPLAETATPGRVPEHFGPVSDLELAAEAARLDEVLHSIKTYGFLDSIKEYGFLAGHALKPGRQIESQVFYQDNGDFRIILLDGNHRTAVLAHLGWHLIPVYPKAGFHPVRLSDSAHWPGVVDGRFTEETARAMFEAFFRPGHQQLLPGW